MSNITFEIIPIDSRYKSLFAENSLRTMGQIKEVPGAYISHVMIYYHNGDSVMLPGEAIRNPIPVSGQGLNLLSGSIKDVVSHVKVFLDVEKLESDINVATSIILGMD